MTRQRFGRAAIVSTISLVSLAIGIWIGMIWRDFQLSLSSAAELPSASASAGSTPTKHAEPPLSSASELPSTAFPAQLESGPWPTGPMGHVQGIAIDQVKGYIYYSFTTLLVKADLTGQVIGTVGGFTGHLGDLDFNPANGRVYGSLEYNAAKANYLAIFDVDKITRKGMKAQNSAIVSTVFLPEVVKDYTADLDGNGKFDGDRGDGHDHRFGCSGIDGVAFGPAFGSADGPQYLTVAYGIYPNDSRTDNDNQVMLQYDVTDWAKYARPLVEGRPHRSGPTQPAGKYFVLTGNTHFGVQSLEYDPSLKRWFMAVYPGSKPSYPNYALFAVDASAQPVLKPIAGNPGLTGLTIPLAQDGLRDPATGIWGWRNGMPFGIQSLGNRMYYVVASTKSRGRNGATVTLERWTGDPNAPFVAKQMRTGVRGTPSATVSLPGPAAHK